MDLKTYFLYLAVMSGVTYLLRAIPFILLKGEITSPFWKSFLAYIPYTVLSAMTVPAIFYATDNIISGVLALVTAVFASLLGRGLVVVAAIACLTVLAVDSAMLVM